MNSPPSASPSWPASATPTLPFGSDTPAHTESGVADLITIKPNRDGQVYNLQNHGEVDRRMFDMEFKLANDSVQIQSFVWYLSTPTNTKPEERKTIESAKAEAQDGILFQRSETSNKTFVCLNVTDAVKRHQADLNKVMVIGIVWDFDKQEGETLSSAFSITPNNDEQVRENVWDKINKSYYNVSRVEITHSGGSGGPNGFPPHNSSSSDDNNNDSNGNGISDMPTTGGNSSSSSSSSSHNHNRGGGLGTGAIAGIAVGVGVAALLAAALGIFFFLRRRRRGTPSTTALHAAEQEKLSSFPKGGAAGGGDTSASDAAAAIAPYRDDNSTLANSHDRRRSSAATGAAVAPGEDVAARDQQQQPSPPKTAAESRHSRMGNGVSRHLVEDGMTAEEIRRLEEEEAQLDDEIQRAGGGRR
ncbi:hypothetical protein MY11210_003278 [Beauveria gryllotalpidicola]